MQNTPDTFNTTLYTLIVCGAGRCLELFFQSWRGPSLILNTRYSVIYAQSKLVNINTEILNIQLKILNTRYQRTTFQYLALNTQLCPLLRTTLYHSRMDEHTILN